MKAPAAALANPLSIGGVPSEKDPIGFAQHGREGCWIARSPPLLREAADQVSNLPGRILSHLGPTLAGTKEMRSLATAFLALCVASTAVVGCGDEDSKTAGGEEDFTSNSGKTLEFSFKGEVLAVRNDTPRRAISAQLQYVQGQLTENANANAATFIPKLTNVREVVEGDKKRISYEAKVAVAWPKTTATPETYELVVPRDTTALAEFNAKYDGPCGHAKYGADTYWYNFNPKAEECQIDAADVHRVAARIAPHPQTTQGAYPEYDKIWSDDTLSMVAVFGIVTSNTPSDDGATTRERLLSEVSGSLRGAQRTEAPRTSGVLKESTVTGKIDVGGRERTVSLTGILVQELAGAGAQFERHYEELTAKADVVVYYGHSGLGKNIKALARTTGAERGHYQLVYLYACQTLGYLDPAMFERRAALNEGDPEGTKYLDIIANTLVAYGDQGQAFLDLYRVIVDQGAPKTFNQILRSAASTHIPIVYGEHDNTFRP
jgi:hypothetical protein